MWGTRSARRRRDTCVTGESQGRTLVRSFGGRRVAWVLALALVVRVAINLANVAPNPGRMFKPDSLEYERYAQNLVEHHTYSMAASLPHAPDSFRPPLYAFLLAFTYWLFGHVPQGMVLLQTVLGVATTYLVYDLGRLTMSPRLGLWSAAVFAVAPAPVLYSGFILSETLFSFLLAWSVRALVGFLSKGDVRQAGASGVLLGLATLTRAIAQFYVVIPIAWLLLFARGGRWRGVSALVGGFAIALLPWMVRNYATVGSAHISTAGQYNLFYCHAASVHRYLHGG